jgi:uncharacterized membrane protein
MPNQSGISLKVADKMKVRPILLFIFWASVICFSLIFYYSDALAYFFGYRNPRFADHSFWFVAHILGATCSLFLGPIQFWKFVRTIYIRYHRLAGKIYIVGTLVAAISAFRLALVFNCVGCRYSLIPLSVLLFFTTACAWYAIRRKNIVAHRQFMVRSYVCALAFVLVRLERILPIGFVFEPITNDNEYAVVAEWTFSILPLLIAEIVMIWIPSLKKPALR